MKDNKKIAVVKESYASWYISYNGICMVGQGLREKG